MSPTEVARAIEEIVSCPNQYDELRCKDGCPACDAMREASRQLRALDAVLQAAIVVSDEPDEEAFSDLREAIASIKIDSRA